eukprot:CAMPEP_0204885226 /NCGR_PEP_ID=MMETSP1349-20130617/12091_1 /ASSEMBLY_ACC=CAM_ASM_000710 /TAXON_ID=215587 /ORGANISM="Aplanochytrium stocchinoi, Strain GSBS06" /LENGTH=248 /DNA_ID=CAMNT_0052046569 /DNA_START=59 /DNA_END=802 /DNA_ORIENTATION=+
MAAQKVILVVGAGRGIGANIGARFAREGYTACLVRRSDQKSLDQTVDLINKAGNGKAHGFLLDATQINQVNELVEKIETSIGPIDVCVYNLGANMGVRSLENTPPHIFEKAWKLGAYGGFLISRAVLPRMEMRQRGTFIFTGATAGLRGNEGQVAHSNGMFARRGMAMSLAHEFWPKGIHVAHVPVDGIVDAPDTLGKFFPELFEKAKAKNETIENIVKPQDVAETYWHLHSQSKGCWTFEMDLRPWK